MSTPPKLTVRADGGPAVGSGHLARAFALLERWTDQGGVGALVTDDPSNPWAGRVATLGCELLDPAAVRPSADWWVADGYALTPRDRDGAGARVLLIDDHGISNTGGKGVDLVLDQNLGARASSYPAAPAALLGPRYALLRREIGELAARRSVTGFRAHISRLVVTVGGAPTPEGWALAGAVAADPRLAHLDIRILSGREDVVAALVDADAAVAAAGSVTWELASAGVPSVLVPLADNQAPVSRGVAALGVALEAEPDVDSIVRGVLDLIAAPVPQRDAMVRAGRALVDGHGASRVCSRLRAALVSLRPATGHDAADLHRWRNDPLTRSGSFSSDEVAWDDHVRWLDDRLDRPGASVLVAEDRSGAVLGVVRFDAVAPAGHEIGVTVAPERRGSSWGSALVEAGCSWLRSQSGQTRVLARIRPDNDASVRVFVAADFDAEPSGADGTLLYARNLDGSSPHHPR